MISAIYAGSFDPWTFGHQFVLDSALKVFDYVHVVVASNPSKNHLLDSKTRAQLVANSIDPFTMWWNQNPPFHIIKKAKKEDENDKHIIVTSEQGLIADYAFEHNILHLIRGLRSTSDFESEFNLYFSNYAISNKLQTWAIICPPDLLHCSSSYVKTVVGKVRVKFVGTSFVAQTLMLKWHRFLGQIFDLIKECSYYRFGRPESMLSQNNFLHFIQHYFSHLYHYFERLDDKNRDIFNKMLNQFLLQNADALLETLNDKKDPKQFEAMLWAILCCYLDFHPKDLQGLSSALTYVERYSKPWLATLSPFSCSHNEIVEHMHKLKEKYGLHD